jgi:hypothetical protein
VDRGMVAETIYLLILRNFGELILMPTEYTGITGQSYTGAHITGK